MQKTRCSTFQDRKGAASRFYMGERKEWQAERSFGAQAAKDLDEIRITGSGSQLFQCFVVAAYAGKVGEDVGKIRQIALGNADHENDAHAAGAPAQRFAQQGHGDGRAGSAAIRRVRNGDHAKIGGGDLLPLQRTFDKFLRYDAAGAHLAADGADGAFAVGVVCTGGEQVGIDQRLQQADQAFFFTRCLQAVDHVADGLAVIAADKIGDEHHRRLCGERKGGEDHITLQPGQFVRGGNDRFDGQIVRKIALQPVELAMVVGVILRAEQYRTQLAAAVIDVLDACTDVKRNVGDLILTQLHMLLVVDQVGDIDRNVVDNGRHCFDAVQQGVVDRHILADAHKHIINVQCKRNEEINVGQVDVIHLLHSLNDGVYQAHRAGVDGKRGTAWQRYILVAHGACHEQEGELVLVAAGENDAVFPLKFCADAVDDRHKMPVQFNEVGGDLVPRGIGGGAKLIHRDEHVQQEIGQRVFVDKKVLAVQAGKDIAADLLDIVAGEDGMERLHAHKRVLRFVVDQVDHETLFVFFTSGNKQGVVFGAQRKMIFCDLMPDELDLVLQRYLRDEQRSGQLVQIHRLASGKQGAEDIAGTFLLGGRHLRRRRAFFGNLLQKFHLAAADLQAGGICVLNRTQMVADGARCDEKKGGHILYGLHIAVLVQILDDIFC